ncbi:MAG: competence protein ComEC, partial [Methylobacteriaceae bacterium]|nr:competence protein ComEC [Methylobacteriaceae bacterium]
MIWRGGGKGQAAAAAGAAAGAGLGIGAWLAGVWRDLRARTAAAFEIELDQRRPFLWLPAAAGSGVLLYMSAAREPPLLLPGLIGVVFAMLAVVGRRRRWLFASCVGLAAVFAGFFSATWRTARIAAPVLDHIRIVHLTGFIEQMDFRRTGARFLLRVAGASELASGAMP